MPGALYYCRKQEVVCFSVIGLDKLCFFLPIILFDYSQKVSLLYYSSLVNLLFNYYSTQIRGYGVKIFKFFCVPVELISTYLRAQDGQYRALHFVFAFCSVALSHSSLHDN